MNPNHNAPAKVIKAHDQPNSVVIDQFNSHLKFQSHYQFSFRSNFKDPFSWVH